MLSFFLEGHCDIFQLGDNFNILHLNKLHSFFFKYFLFLFLGKSNVSKNIEAGSSSTAGCGSSNTEEKLTCKLLLCLSWILKRKNKV